MLVRGEAAMEVDRRTPAGGDVTSGSASLTSAMLSALPATVAAFVTTSVTRAIMI